MNRRFLGLLGLGLVVPCLAMACGALRTRSQALALLEDLKQLDKNADTWTAVHAFRQKHRNVLVNEECTGDLCGWELQINNWTLSKVRLAPRTELHIRITLFRHKLATVGVDYTSSVFRHDSPVVHVQEDFCAERTDIPCDHFALNPHGCNVTPTWNGNIEFGQSATRKQKAAAWGLNLNCLTALHGCKDISQLSPEIWRATGPGAVSTRLRSTADSAAEASQPLCG